jgi:copper chaperone CopZ
MFNPVLTRVGFVFALVLFAGIVGCQPQGDSTASTKDVTVEITGMSCAKGCAPRARDALAKLPWATNVKVDFDKKLGTFVAETAAYDEQAILKALKDEDFEGKILK